MPSCVLDVVKKLASVKRIREDELRETIWHIFDLFTQVQSK